MRALRGSSMRCGFRITAPGPHTARMNGHREPRVRASATPQPSVQSVRQPKNPKDFASMDELRESLHRQSGFQLSFASLLNWFSDSAFGYNGETFRFLGRLYKQLTQFQLTGAARQDRYEDIDLLLQRLDQERVRELQTLMLCSSRTVAIIARKYPPLGYMWHRGGTPAEATVLACGVTRTALWPQIMTMQLRELGFRMIALKTLLPGCDAARLVEMQPRAFLGRPQQQVARQVKSASRLLRAQLPGADVDRMIQEDPLLLFTEITSGIQRLRELWDVDEQALRNSNPGELALAVRALSDSGPPRRF